MAMKIMFGIVTVGIAVASASTYEAYDPQCRPEGDRCIGAAGYQAVDWIPCCDGYECTADDTSYGGYGKLCAPKPVQTYATEPPAPKCRPEGDRCIGAAGYPAVDWIPCCDGYECTSDDSSYGGYGKLCAPKPVQTYTTEPPAPKCRPEGDRCIGAAGYPAVDWIPCCNGYDCTADDTSYGGYGKICAPKAVKTYPTEPPAPKCRAEGDRCKGAAGYPAVDWIPCCDGYECSAEDTRYGGYGMLCAPKKYYTEAPKTTKAPVYTEAPKTTKAPVYTEATTTTEAPMYTTAAPKCVKEGKECDTKVLECCKDLECVASGKYDYTLSCEPVKVYTTEPPTTTSTAPKCVDAGEECGEYKPCCDYAECKKDDYGISSICVTMDY